jgi:tRNA(adenine34) deaminase
MNIHEGFMRKAIAEAKKAADVGEVPIGAVAVIEGRVVARAHNVREKTCDPMGHAEILLIKKLSKKMKTWRLTDAIFYVTCEPCIMCAGAMLQARIKKVIYGCMDPKAGAMGSLYDLSKDPRLNHSIEVVSGVCSDECSGLLGDFFRVLRNS